MRQPPDDFADGVSLLRKENDASVLAPFGRPAGVGLREVGNVVCHDDGARCRRIFHLRVVVHACDPSFVRRRHFDPVLAQCGGKRVDWQSSSR